MDFFKYNEKYTKAVQQVRHDFVQGKIEPKDVLPSLLAIDYAKPETDALTLSVEFMLFVPHHSTKATMASLEVHDWGGKPIDEAILKQFTLYQLQQRLVQATDILVAFREAYHALGVLTQDYAEVAVRAEKASQTLKTLNEFLPDEK